jgi:hypothetical protein
MDQRRRRVLWLLVGCRCELGSDVQQFRYTEGAKKRAAGAAPKIELEVMTLSEVENFDWDEFLNDGVRSRNASEPSIGITRVTSRAAPAAPGSFDW